MSGMFGGVFRRSPKKKVHPLPVLLSIGAGDGQQATVGTAVAVRPRFDTTYAADGTAAPGVPVNITSGVDGFQYHLISDANGHCTLPSDWVLAPTAGTNTLTASIAGSTITKSITATGLAGAAAILVAVTALEQNADPNTGVPVLPKVQAVDAQQNGVAGVSITYAVAGGGGSGSGLTGVTDASGFFEVGSWTTGGSAGLNSMTATAAGLAGSPLTFHASVSASLPVSIEWFSGDGQSVAAGTTYIVPLVARVLDGSSSPVQGINVVLEALTGGGSVPAPLVTGSDGKASFLPTAGTVAGAGSWRAKFFDQGGTQVAVDDSFTIVAGAAHHLVITTQPDSHTTSGQPLPQQPILKVVDQYGNLVTAGTYHVTRSVVSGDATLSGNTTVDSVAGIVTYTALVVTDATGGDSQIDFQATGLLDVISDPVTTSPPTPHHVGITSQPPASVPLGQFFTCAAAVEDVSNAIVTGDTSQITVELSGGLIGQTLNGTLAVLCIGGVATFTGLSITGAAATGTLTFRRAGLIAAVSISVSAVDTPATGEPAGMTTVFISNLSLVTPDTAFSVLTNGVQNALLDGRKWQNPDNKTFVRRISQQASKLLLACPAAAAVPPCPNGSDYIETTEFGGSATFPAGDQSHADWPFQVNAKTIWLGGYILASSNWHGNVAGSCKLFYLRTKAPAGTSGQNPFLVLLYGANLTALQLRPHYVCVAALGVAPSGTPPVTNYIAPTVNIVKNQWYFLDVALASESSLGAGDGRARIKLGGTVIHENLGINGGASNPGNNPLKWSGDRTVFDSTQQILVYFGGTGNTNVPDKQFVARGDGWKHSYSLSRIAI